MLIGTRVISLAALILSIQGCASSNCFSVGTGISGDRVPISGERLGSLPIRARRASQGLMQRFAFANRDHDKRIEMIGISKAFNAPGDPPPVATGRFTDVDASDDVWDFSARWCRAVGAGVGLITFSEAVGTCASTSCLAEIPDFTADRHFVLVDFTLQTRTAGVDQNVRSMAIMPEPQDSGGGSGRVRVSFNGSSTLSAGFTYAFRYALVPADAFDVFSEDDEGLIDFRSSLRGDADTRYIGGFSLSRPGFGGEAGLSEVAVDVRTGSGRFEDHDGGERVRWIVNYVVHTP